MRIAVEPRHYNLSKYNVVFTVVTIVGLNIPLNSSKMGIIVLKGYSSGSFQFYLFNRYINNYAIF